MTKKPSEMDRLIQRYIKNLSDSVSEKTKIDYESDLNMFSEYLADNNLEIKLVTLEHLENYAEHLRTKPIKSRGTTKEGYAPSSRSRMLQVVKFFMDYLTEIKYITSNPSEILKLPKIPKREIVYLTLKQAKKLLNAIDDEDNKFLRLRDRAIILMILNHGCRVDEMSKVKISDIKDKTIKIIGKGNKERTLILTDDVITAINEYKRVRFDVNTDYLFLSTRRQAMSKRAMQEMAYKYFDKAGLKGYSIHKIRSTAATLMSDNGIETSDIQEILGHESILTTKRYTATSRIKKEQIANKMNGLFTN